MDVGLLHTDGFRDQMDMGRGVRPVEAGVDPFYQRPHEKNPLVPKHLRRPVKERTPKDGAVLFALKENIDELREEVDYLSADSLDYHAYNTGGHKMTVQEFADIVREEFDGLVTVDHDAGKSTLVADVSHQRAKEEFGYDIRPIREPFNEHADKIR